MDIVMLSCYGCGYYSGAEYEESLVISKDFYDKIADKIKDETVYLGELDGKHSEVESEITIESYTEEEIKERVWDFSYDDGDSLYCKVSYICRKLNLDLYEEIQRTEDYMNSLDTFTYVEVKVRKSDKEKVLKFAEELNK